MPNSIPITSARPATTRSAAPGTGDALPSDSLRLFGITVAAFTGAGLVAGITGGSDLYQSVVGFVSGMVVVAVGVAVVTVPLAVVARALGLQSQSWQRWRSILAPSIGLVFAGLFLAMFVLFVIGSMTGWIPPGPPCTADCGSGGD